MIGAPILHGKILAIIGAPRGIGPAIARRAACGGANVMTAARSALVADGDSSRFCIDADVWRESAIGDSEHDAVRPGVPSLPDLFRDRHPAS